MFLIKNQHFIYKRLLSKHLMIAEIEVVTFRTIIKEVPSSDRTCLEKLICSRRMALTTYSFAAKTTSLFRT